MFITVLFIITTVRNKPTEKGLTNCGIYHTTEQYIALKENKFVINAKIIHKFYRLDAEC